MSSRRKISRDSLPPVLDEHPVGHRPPFRAVNAKLACEHVAYKVCRARGVSIPRWAGENHHRAKQTRYRMTGTVFTYSFRCISRLDSGALEEEAARGDGLALPLAKGRHELLQLGGSLDLEEDLVVVVADFDVQVLRVGRLFGLGGRASVLIFG